MNEARLNNQSTPSSIIDMSQVEFETMC